MRRLITTTMLLLLFSGTGNASLEDNCYFFGGYFDATYFAADYFDETCVAPASTVDTNRNWNQLGLGLK